MEEIDQGWQIIEGSRPILIVAGHNFAQGREGFIKASDMGTGEIARTLCQTHGLWGIVSTREQLDPNWYEHSPFREKVKELIKIHKMILVVDVHGSSLNNTHLVELIGNKMFIDKHKDIKTKHFIDDRQITLGEELDVMVPVVEIEIREDGRVTTINPVKYRETEQIINDLFTKLLYEN